MSPLLMSLAGSTPTSAYISCPPGFFCFRYNMWTSNLFFIYAWCLAVVGLARIRY